MFGKALYIARNGSNVQSFVYDANQQLCKRLENGQVTGYGYDGAGNLIWSAAGMNGYTLASCDITTGNAGNQLVTRTYDARNRLSTLHFQDGDGDQSWSYTPDGLPDTITTDNASTPVVTNTYLYDKRRLMSGEGLTISGQFTWAVGYGYDANGHLSTRFTPSGQTYAYQPDALGRPTQLGIPNVNTYVASVSYYPDSHISQFQWNSGLTHTVTENLHGLPSEIHDSMTGNDAEDMAYAYDADGDPTQISDLATGARSETLAYDGLDRMISARDAQQNTTTYSYNSLDQITATAQGTHTRSFSYHGYYTDQLIKVVDSVSGETDYGYDVQGNLATRNGVQYSFDYGNRLRNVIGYEGSYAYDANGRRVQQVNSSGALDSFYDHTGALIYQQARDGTTHDYLYLQGRLVAIRDYDVNGVATAMRYQHTDALGSIIRQTDRTGAEIVGNVYDPWGKLLAGATPDSPGYTGHVMDASTNLIYMQQRYYDPDAMRFLSMDPVDASTSNGSNLDRYWYASDNPYKNIDPDGRTCKKVGSSYSCEIDKVATQVNGKTVIRNATAADHKTYAAVEKSLTRAVNVAATSGKTENISVKSGGTTYSFSISGAKIASALAIRVMTVDPDSSPKAGAMDSPSNRATNINRYGIDPTQGHPGARTAYGDADRTRSMEFLHEGIHWSSEEAKGFGAAEPLLGTEPLSTDHQAPYDAAADDILGH